jgi:transposase
MTATKLNSTGQASGRLYVAFELGWAKIKVASSCDALQKPRIKVIPARDLQALQAELAKAKVRFGLPADAPVFSCYEAGRDAFWLHRWLCEQGIQNVVVDPGSLKVNRRRKRAKTDTIDARLLLEHLLDHCAGKKVWSVVRVPTLEQETGRQLHRDLKTMQAERTAHVNRMKSILAALGIELDQIDGKFATWLGEQRLLENGQAVPSDFQERLLREFQRWQSVDEQIKALAGKQRQRVRQGGSKTIDKVRRLLELKGIGIKSAWLFGLEFFGWRTFQNRRQVGALAGLTPTPYQSGKTEKELGLSKAGNRWIRAMIVEIAWGWLKWQPGSALSQWFLHSYGKGSGLARKKGIVALARKLLVALWHWVEHGQLPQGAVTVAWQTKLRLRAEAAA